MLPGFRRTAEFAEQERWTRLESGIHVYVNARQQLRQTKRKLIIYATPNGNTIEQTLGCAMVEGRDWHFDIQHVAAQIRELRDISPDEDLVLAVVQAPKLSWPTFRQAEAKAGEIIRGLVESLTGEVGAKQVVLSGHSGGGSFIFGYINSVETIPASIERIIFLDANYAYSDDEKHGDKLLQWLRIDTHRHLVVVAYDDREITLDGKKVVGPTGGTFRASGRMIDRFVKDIALSDDKHGPFDHRRGLNGQIEFYIHPNPANKILHTALVGEMNGLLNGLTLGTSSAEFGGPRAYLKWVQTTPFIDDSSSAELRPTLKLPPRRVDAPSGGEFLLQIESMSREDREAAVLKQILQGNIPEALRLLKPIYVEATDSQGAKHTATYFVTSDYLGVGAGDQFFRMPITPMTAQKIATATDASLITAKISDDIFRHAELKCDPQPLTKDRESVVAFVEHSNLIDDQRARKHHDWLIAGIKKDVVLTNRLAEKPHRVAIYGWHYPDGKPIQPLYVGHVDWYVDYSHGIRLMSQQMFVDGQPRRAEEILKDKELSVLLSNEGPITAGY